MSPTAFGLRLLRPGFAVSAELDRGFALGWPHAVLELAADAGTVFAPGSPPPVSPRPRERDGARV